MKAILCGNSTVGKTSLLNALTNEKKFGPTMPTLGAGCANVSFEYKNQVITMNLWDTAGQEAYRSLTKVAILVFDVTVQQSFDDLENWIHDINENCEKETPILIIANKIDLIESRVVSCEDVAKKARYLNCPFMEVSAKTKTGLKEMMMVAYRMGLSEKVPIDPTEEFLASEFQTFQARQDITKIDLNGNEEKTDCC